MSSKRCIRTKVAKHSNPRHRLQTDNSSKQILHSGFSHTLSGLSQEGESLSFISVNEYCNLLCILCHFKKEWKILHILNM
jgi:hypothetical protein